MADNPKEKITPASRQYPDPQSKLKQDPPTTGHSWDGIEEYDNPMPRWWVWIFLITVVWSVGYWIAYPAWPGIQSATSGLLGYSSRANVAAEIDEFEARNETWFAQLVETDLDAIREDPDLHRFAVNAGASVFAAQCSQCHGTGGAGVQAAGYPNLLNDAWLWGGTMEDITTTVTWGIRNDDYPEARWSQMPAFGVDGLLDDQEITEITHYVLRMSGQDHDEALADAGAEEYEWNCASCHGDGGEGDYELGAPALNNQVWFYGGSEEAIRHSIYYSRFGVMPGFETRLREAEIRAVAAYVHQLGGGQ
ncbi:cytochrome-c oxidase, cbb3-type subunit III [Rhodobacteraceae bacterium 2376]|uniref:Cbb3-type cytochrome c oxidase subunit n=1 Tax=Rhabdonatronobacter sediminivivens TaxID=2743469 RepID=A0A7Z0KZH8_9RHOB|nr:cytochrome-c oxidase, cbb3-type subunit III [Rhabdonatronobacter sediminivivens]NYS24443.1 cytochrome-c oxidase, cbb3-type subunit III [Rhabdonatronobacter sediminivivens]